jgi:hypothetical protein
MTEVTKDRYFSMLSADKRDIMPSHRERNFTTWETQNREVFGWSSPGWNNPEDPKVYAVVVKRALGLDLADAV